MRKVIVALVFLAVGVVMSQSAVIYSASIVPNQGPAYGYAYNVNDPIKGDIKEHHEGHEIIPVVAKVATPAIAYSAPASYAPYPYAAYPYSAYPYAAYPYASHPYAYHPSAYAAYPYAGYAYGYSSYPYSHYPSAYVAPFDISSWPGSIYGKQT